MELARVLKLVLLAACVFLGMQGPALAQGGAASSQPAEYRLGPEDVVQIRVYGRDDLSGPAALDPSGKLQLPLVGQIDAAGRTPAELTRLLSERYRIIDPRILEASVVVTQYGSQKVTVLGEVRNPGPHAFPQIPDLLGVILAAGGVTPQADLARVQVVRHEEQAGEPRTITVDLSRGLEQTTVEELPEIRSKDTVIIPSMVGEFASGDRFQVLGAVNAPGSYRLPVAATLVEAIAASGGAAPGADLRKVRLTRATQTGALTYELDLQSYLYTASPGVDLDVRPGDTVVVPSKQSTLAAIFDKAVRITPVISLALGLGYAFR